MKQEFDLEQLKRDGGRCLYDDDSAYACVLPSGTIVVEVGPSSIGAWHRFFADQKNSKLRNLPKKKLVQWWRRTDSDGYVGEFLGVDMDHTPGDGWIKVAEKEIYEGEGL